MKINTITISILMVISALIFAILSAADSVEQQNTSENITVKTKTIFSIKTKSLGINRDLNLQKILVNITTERLGHLTYIENYYSVDFEGNPKFYSSGRYYDQKITSSKISFEILRPRRGRKTYTLLEAKVMIDNKTIFEDFIVSGKTYKLTRNVTVKKTEARENESKEIDKSDSQLNATDDEPLILETLGMPDEDDKNIDDDGNNFIKYIALAAIAVTVIMIYLIMRKK